VYPVYKFIAIFVSTCLLLSETLAYGGTVPAAPTPTVTHNVLIPEALGTLDESYVAKGTGLKPVPNKMIYYIQDAHDSLEAQENIAKIINHLVQHQGVTTVFEEGYEGEVPTDEFFGFIKDEEVKEKVAYFLMDKLRIGGAEYAHINRKQDFKLIGADNINLHLENIEWYRKSAQNKEQTAKETAQSEINAGNRSSNPATRATTPRKR